MKNNSKTLSVIVPVYNGARTIIRAIDSVVNQSFKDIQLVIVNDGSTDETEKLIFDYFKDKCFDYKYISIQNGGLANARNVGWDNANGEFCCNLDSDDYFEQGIFDKVFGLKEDFDVCYYGFRDVTPGGEVLFSYETRFKYECFLSGQEAARKKLKREIWICQGSAVYKKRIVMEAKIQNVPGINQGEDLLFITSVLAASKTVNCIDCIGVNIEASSTSMMHSRYNESFAQSIQAAKLLYKYLERFNNKSLLSYARVEIYNQVARVLKVLILSSGYSIPKMIEKIREIKGDEYSDLKSYKSFIKKRKYIEFYLVDRFPLIYIFCAKMYKKF